MFSVSLPKPYKQQKNAGAAQTPAFLFLRNGAGTRYTILNNDGRACKTDFYTAYLLYCAMTSSILACTALLIDSRFETISVELVVISV